MRLLTLLRAKAAHDMQHACQLRQQMLGMEEDEGDSLAEQEVDAMGQMRMIMTLSSQQLTTKSPARLFVIGC